MKWVGEEMCCLKCPTWVFYGLNLTNCNQKLHLWTSVCVCGGVTLRQVWWDVRHFLGVDVRPVEVVIWILLVITLREALVEGTAPCKQKESAAGWVVIDRIKMILMCHYAEAADSKQNFLPCFSLVPLSQLINNPPGVPAPTAITQGQSGSPLTQPPSLQLIIWAHRQSLGTNMCELAAGGSS